jgi:DNA-binding LacI/PurR family transcriptional regulator
MNAPGTGGKRKKDAGTAANKPASLKTLAEYLGLSPATISVVLNDVPGRSIPQSTRDRIKAAAEKLNYQPSLLARSLRNRQTLTIGILVPELGEGYHTQVLSGIGDCLMQQGYFYFTAHHRHKKELIEQYSRLLTGRGAEALIVVDTALEHDFPVPVVAVAGHRHIAGVTNVILDHHCAAELALHHLYDLGHRKIAFMRGQPFSSDSEDRWSSTLAVAAELGLEVQPELVVQLDRDLTSPELGYPVIEQLLYSHQGFTALLSFNDMAAIGAIRALQDAGLRVPEDVSVVGFDDIKGAAFNNPSLTTIRQPLEEMGRTAARIALSRIQGKHEFEDEIAIEPELVTRESTCAPGRSPGAAQGGVLSKGTASGAGPSRPAARSGDEAG